jgi:hypothetical protein
MQGAVHGISWHRHADGRLHAVAASLLAPGAAAAGGWGEGACARDALTALDDASAALAALPGGARLTLAAGARHALLDAALLSDGVCFINFHPPRRRRAQRRRHDPQEACLLVRRRRCRRCRCLRRRRRWAASRASCRRRARCCSRTPPLLRVVAHAAAAEDGNEEQQCLGHPSHNIKWPLL